MVKEEDGRRRGKTGKEGGEGRGEGKRVEREEEVEKDRSQGR